MFLSDYAVRLVLILPPFCRGDLLLPNLKLLPGALRFSKTI